MKFKVPYKSITFVSLDGNFYPVQDGEVEIPEAILGPDFSHLGYEPVAAAPPLAAAPPAAITAKRKK